MYQPSVQGMCHRTMDACPAWLIKSESESAHTIDLTFKRKGLRCLLSLFGFCGTRFALQACQVGRRHASTLPNSSTPVEGTEVVGLHSYMQGNHHL